MSENNVGRELVMRPDTATATNGAVGVPDRATRVASWLGWHFFELTGVTVPAVVALTATPWAWAVSGVVGAGWTVHEVRLARQNAAVLAGRDLPTTPEQTPRQDEDADAVTDVNSTDVPADDAPAGPAGGVAQRSERVGGRDGVA